VIVFWAKGCFEIVSSNITLDREVEYLQQCHVKMFHVMVILSKI